MLNINEVIETNQMIHEMNLDVRTITMGISLLTVHRILWIRFARIYIRK